MRDAVHREGIEADFFFHDRTGVFPVSARSDAGLSMEIVVSRRTLARHTFGNRLIPLR
jgi:hypothetical protein